MSKQARKCYYCAQMKANYQLIKNNTQTVAYLMGENTYLCKDYDYLLRVGKIMGEKGGIYPELS